MPTVFTLQLQAGDVLLQTKRIETAAKDASPLMKDVLLLMIRSTQLNFQSQGRPDRWDDLKESTERRRFKRASKRKGASKLGSLGVLASMLILRDTGRLMQSLGEGRSGEFDAKGGFGETDDFNATLGTNAPGWQNQEDDTRGWRDARPFILFQTQDEEDIADMGMDFLMGRGPYAAAG